MSSFTLYFHLTLMYSYHFLGQFVLSTYTNQQASKKKLYKNNRCESEIKVK